MIYSEFSAQDVTLPTENPEVAEEFPPQKKKNFGNDASPVPSLFFLGLEPKIGGKTGKIIHLFIGFGTIINTHPFWWVKSPYFWFNTHMDDLGREFQHHTVKYREYQTGYSESQTGSQKRSLRRVCWFMLSWEDNDENRL